MNRGLNTWKRSNLRPVDLYQEMDSFLNSFMTKDSDNVEKTFTPSINVAESDTEYEVSADLPGVNSEEVNVEVHEGQLLISGERESAHEESDKKFHRVERTFGKFERRIGLPENVSESDISADYQDGVLTIVLPKSEKPKPTRIEVKAVSSN